MRLHRLIGAIAALLFVSLAPAADAAAYKNFRAAIYITVGDTKRLADPAVFERQFARVSSQLKFDKVYIEAYRDRVFASDSQLEAVKREFQAKGIKTSGGITLAAGGSGGQFGTFDYENPADRAECERAVRLIARHFDEVILDDFFFYTSKSDADIAARGQRSWTDYRLDKMREASRDLVLSPARQENPRVRVIIKYPNWYEHFHGLGYDLAEQAHMFDAIYTGTETSRPGDNRPAAAAIRELRDLPLSLERPPGREPRRVGRHLLDPGDRSVRRAALGWAVRQGRRADAIQLERHG